MYDSIPSYSFSSYTLRQQLAAVLKTPEKSFTIRFVEVQRQSGSSDCGAFAIAFAFALCSGLDPHMASLNQAELCQHLLSCFENRSQPLHLDNYDHTMSIHSVRLRGDGHSK